MRSFSYSRPADVSGAVAAVHRQSESKYLGGGTNLVDLMKMGVEHPAHLVDVTRLPLAKIEEHGGGLRIGAMVRNSEAAAHPIVRRRYPVLADAILAGASPQIRNMATTGGNLLQRTRCPYFYDPSYRECNKRMPGSGCAAMLGYSRMHAILGASEHCIATYPGDMAVALTALDARIVLHGAQGERTVPIDQFYRPPGDTPQIENDLRPGELITAVELPKTWADKRSHYLKVRDRNSYAFALVSAAAVLDVGPDGRIRQARLALGSVAPKPWRDASAEDALRGQMADAQVFRRAAELLVRDARTRHDNAFKVELARRAMVRALTEASAAA